MTTSPVQRSLFPQLDALSQEEVVRTLTPHLPLLWDAIMDPWRDFLGRRAEDRCFQEMAEDEAAMWLTMRASHRLRGFFGGADGWRVLTRHGKLVLLLEERLAITVKKLTKRRRRCGARAEITRSNYPTESNQRYWEQRRCNEGIDVPRVILGYLLLEEITQIKILIAYPRSKKRGVEWAWEVPDQTQSPAEPFHPRVAEEPADGAAEGDKGYTITAADHAAESVGSE